MKIKNKIALTFTLITSGLLIGICLSIYYLFQQYTRNDFYKELGGRAKIAAAFQLEEDELGQKVFSEIRSKHMLRLPSEQEFLVDLDAPFPGDSLPAFIDPSFIQLISNRKYAVKHWGDSIVVGIHYEDNQGDYAVIIASRDELGEEELIWLQKVLLVIVVGAVALVFLIGRWYANEALAPLNVIIRRMHRIDTNNLHLRIESGKTKDEINQVAHAFNKLLDRIETSIETQNNFISNASHELKTPLTAILGEIDVGLNGSRTNEEYRQCLVRVEKQAEVLKSLTIRLLRLAQVGVSEDGKAFIPVRIDELLVDVAEEFNQAHPGAHILLHFEHLPEEPRELELMANLNLLKIAFANLIDNAWKFSGGKKVDVFLQDEGSHVSIRVCDQGVGIPEDAMEKIFDPFFRAENVMDIHGFGVGLPLVKKIIHIHEGQMDVYSDVEQGTAFTIRLPKRQF